MNEEQTLKAIEVMQAYVEGKKIQYYWNAAGRWIDVDPPIWEWASGGEYRVKPVSKPSINWDHVRPVYKWLATDADGGTYVYKEEPTAGDYKWWSSAHSWGCGRVADIFESFIPGDC